MPKSTTSIRVPSHGVGLRVLVRAGDPEAVPFVLVHGLASNARLWDGVGDGLAAMGHASVAVDLRGHGESDVPEEGYDFSTISHDLDAAVAATLDRPAIVVGQSWGGNVALEFATRHPDRVAGVVVVDGGFLRLRDDFPEWESARRRLAPPPIDGMAWSDLERGMRARLDGFPEAGIVGQMANFRQDGDGSALRRLPVPRHLDILRHLWEHDPDETVAALSVPVLVIAVSGGTPGKHDRVAAFLRRARRGSLVWMDGHHDVHAQFPEAVAGHLRGFALDLRAEVE